MHKDIEACIVDGLPTVSVSPGGWSPKMVCDWLRQTMWAKELYRYTDKQLYSMVYTTLRKLRKKGLIDAAYGLGDNGQEALTYNKLG